MTDTLNDTFSNFFDDSDNDTCIDCNATENLEQLGSATGGSQMWICPIHKAAREKASRKEQQKAQDEIARIVAMDEWEE